MVSLLHQVMHAVAIKRNGGADSISSISGLNLESVIKTLNDGVSLGRLVKIDDTFLLSPAGRMILDSEYSRFCDEIRSQGQFLDAYEKFEIINKELKQLITDWQTIKVGDQVIPNDHSDSEYDEKIIDKLGVIHEKFEPVLAIMVESIGRFANYSAKLIKALEKSEDGELEWVSDAKLDSYHTVWFELHEDLLRLLGRSREE
tara:strand:- start:3286 stop:3891 length:606 start_codon:yes stop_codon:yes gene_type:complete